MKQLTKIIATITIRIYKITLSPILFAMFGKSCKYEVTCSSFTLDKINEKGLVGGLQLGLKRFSSCHPFSKVYTNEVLE